MENQTNSRKSNKKSRIISISVTLLVVLMLILSGPASAVKVEMKTPIDYTVGGKAIFEINLKLTGADSINVKSINVTHLPLGNISFYPNGTILPGCPQGYTVTRIESAPYFYGYGYGYDENPGIGYGYGYDFGKGYGYGYGYGYGHDDDGPVSNMKYRIEVSGLSVGTYSNIAKIDVNVEGNPNKLTFSAEIPYTFNVKKKPSGGGGGGGVSNQYTQTQTMRNGVASFWGNIGETIPSIEIPGATGSITVEELSSNPTNVKIDEHVFFYLDINTGENANKAGTITFKVSTTSLADAGIDRNNIALYRFNNGNWEELATQWSKTVDGYEEYTAQTPGFSAFLIAEKGVAPTITATPTLTPGPTEEIEELTPTSTKKGIPGFEAFGLITGVLTAAYIIMRKRG